MEVFDRISKWAWWAVLVMLGMTFLDVSVEGNLIISSLLSVLLAGVEF